MYWVCANELDAISLFDHWQKVDRLPAQAKPCNTSPPPSWAGGIAGRPDIQADGPFVKESEGISLFDHWQKDNRLPTQSKP